MRKAWNLIKVKLMKKFVTAIFMMTLIVWLTACSSSAPRLPPKESDWKNAGPSVLVKSYKMAVGDQIRINVWKNSELSF